MANITWTAQPRQEKFLLEVLNPTGADEILYGGAAGGGKTDALLIAAIIWCQKYPGSWVLFLRRTFPELEQKPIPRSKELIPQSIAKYNESKHRWTFHAFGGSVLQFGSLDKEGDESKYQSAEYSLIIWDELTHFLAKQYIYMISRNRCSKIYADFKPKVISGTNPGGVGHGWVKERWIDPQPPEKVWAVPQDEEDIRLGLPERKRVFIPAKVSDNQILLQANPGYISAMKELPEAERKALLDGSWDSFSGQYFKCWNRDLHVTKPFEIPRWWKHFLSLDYGLDMCACYEHVTDQTGKPTTISEIYQKDLSLPEAAEVIRERFEGGKYQYLVASPDLWNRRQETGRSGIEILMANGLKKLHCPIIQADDRRIMGWQNMYDYLMPRKNEEGGMSPYWRIFDNCTNLIRTLPNLVRDDKNPNDIAGGCDDHGAESCRYFLKSRPPISKSEEKQKEDRRRKIKETQPLISKITRW